MAGSSFSVGLSVMEASLFSGLLLMEHCNAEHGRGVLLLEFFLKDTGVDVMEGDDCYKIKTKFQSDLIY